jgi:AcrR family transcriptional regulator
MVETARQPRGGRRDRNMQEKRDRIFEAASALFAERGFQAVTTSEVAERADVAAGTLFRYAASKGELLLMVYNERFRAAIDEGQLAARAHVNVVDAVVALVLPVIELAQRTADDGVWYQRELMFGPPSEQYRAEGLALVERLETAIATELARAESADQDAVEPSEDAVLAGRTIFAIVHLAAVSASNRGHLRLGARDTDLRQQIAHVIAGYRGAVDDPSKSTPQHKGDTP